MSVAVKPKLAPPGAGLPAIEWAVAKYILLPRLFKETSKQKALEAFSLQSTKISRLCDKLTVSQLEQARLIPRLRGLEDSSRFWSVAMTLEHLVIVGDGMRKIVLALSNGQTGMATRGTADVKPAEVVDASKILHDFEAMSARFLADTKEASIYAYPQATHAHPWFGPLNAAQWLAFGAVHEEIHYKQIEAIISRL